MHAIGGNLHLLHNNFKDPAPKCCYYICCLMLNCAKVNSSTYMTKHLLV